MEQTVTRFPLPDAYEDKAFFTCLLNSVENQELVKDFDRLCGCDMSFTRTRRPAGERQSDFEKFVAFIHDTIYMRLPDEAIVAMRAEAA
jgi:hypothetical protein